jgi:superfamily II RNA helicase
MLPFSLSPFQIKANDAIRDGKHALVTAPTGSGKTLPAEHAIKFFTERGQTVVYTAPIKALSNQKYSEFTRKFPNLEVGIFTGDNKHNAQAQLLIMTTEILQNRLFQEKGASASSTSYLDFSLDNLGCVIFDEVHYVSDEDRGTVWENTIIMLPKTVQFVMLSATIDQPENFAAWVQDVTEREVVVCGHAERVVPLTFSVFMTATQKQLGRVENKATRSFIESKVNKFEPIYATNARHFHDGVVNENRKALTELRKVECDPTRKHVLNELCTELKKADMFPALCFVFSRKQVEQIAQEVTVSLFDEGEVDSEIEPTYRQLLVAGVTNWKEYMALPEYHVYLDLLRKGIGIHPAGMLPIFREVMEILFERRCIKLLVATETFAIGLNMPTKTVCFTCLSKHDKNGHRWLYPHEFIQMAGRAGRRGIDTRGNVVLLTNLFRNPYLDTQLCRKLLNPAPVVLSSKFKLGYALVLYYSERFTQADVTEFVQKSLMNRSIVKQILQARLEIAVLQTEEHPIQLDDAVTNVFRQYDDLKMREDLTTKLKDRRKLTIEREALEQANLDAFTNLYGRWAQLKVLRKMKAEKNRTIESLEAYVPNQVKAIYHILENHGFLNGGPKQLFAKHLHEVHPLVLADCFIQNRTPPTYTFTEPHQPTELFAFLSCFIELKVGADVKVNRTPTALLAYAQMRLDYYADLEYQHGLASSGYTDALQFDLYDVVEEWMKEDTPEACVRILLKLKEEKGVFSGEFIKACLKMVNIARELEAAFGALDMLEMVENVREGSKRLMKFVCTNASLYL